MLRSSLFWAGTALRLLFAKRHMVLQSARTDCGVASVLTVLNLLGRHADPVDAAEVLDRNREGSSLEAMRRYMVDVYGLGAEALAARADQLGRVKGHVILHMHQQHYVVLLRCARAGLLVFDPAVGVVFYPLADFAALYSGHCLAVTRRGGSGQTLPQAAGAGRVVGGADPARARRAGLFVLGVTSRMMECGLLLCLVAALYMVLNHASMPAILTVAGLIAACGGLLLITRQTRFGAEDALARGAQARLWRGMLRAVMRGRDLAGFRGRYERDVSGSVRRGMMMALPQRAQVPGALGGLLGLTALLAVLSPVIALVHAMLFLGLIVLMQLDDVQLCRLSVRKGVGRYSRLSAKLGLPGGVVAPDLMGEVAKWTVIGFAGFGVLFWGLPPVALMFWILTGMQIVPQDFKRVAVLSPALGGQQAISPLVAAEVPMRGQAVPETAKVRITEAPALLRIDNIAALTEALHQPDLTVREQRLIMAEAVRNAIALVPDDTRPEIGPIRIFGPGQDATQPDFDHLLTAHQARSGQVLPMVQGGTDLRARVLKDPVLRNLCACASGDFPVFWDLRNRMAVEDIRTRMTEAGLTRAGHLTMKRLTVVQAA
ncbi:MAG: hypothetical protein CML02_03690 [Pseudooceanicola sp.]|jgi:predicted double-glycine peptidase|nr:hypothetical protein [Pseudooceanicola sp.]